MRRVLCAVTLVASSFGFLALPAGADSSTSPGITLSFDYSDNTTPASASNGVFNVIVDVIPAHTPGAVKIVATAPANSGDPNLVCAFQNIAKDHVECAFNFTSSGVWSIHALYATSAKDPVTVSAIANLRVGN